PGERLDVGVVAAAVVVVGAAVALVAARTAQPPFVDVDRRLFRAHLGLLRAGDAASLGALGAVFVAALGGGAPLVLAAGAVVVPAGPFRPVVDVLAVAVTPFRIVHGRRPPLQSFLEAR